MPRERNAALRRASPKRRAVAATDYHTVGTGPPAIGATPGGWRERPLLPPVVRGWRHRAPMKQVFVKTTAVALRRRCGRSGSPVRVEQLRDGGQEVGRPALLDVRMSASGERPTLVGGAAAG